MPEGANLNRLVDPTERVVELLAIKLFEHAPDSAKSKHWHPTIWFEASEEERERFRRMARGEEELP